MFASRIDVPVGLVQYDNRMLHKIVAYCTITDGHMDGCKQACRPAIEKLRLSSDPLFWYFWMRKVTYNWNLPVRFCCYIKSNHLHVYTVSIDKCCILSIGRAQLPVTDFCIDGQTLSSVPSCRDLGVIISHDLKPAVHIAQMVTKAHQRANAILRSFVSRDVALLVRAFIVYV